MLVHLSLLCSLFAMAAMAALALRRTQGKAGQRRAEQLARHSASPPAPLLPANALACLSHELRSPLAGIISHAELLQADPRHAGAPDHLALIARSARALLAMAEEQLAQPDPQPTSANSATTHIADELRDCVMLLEPMAAAKNLALGLWVDDSVPDMMAGNPLWFRQVVINLVANAIKFTPDGAIDVEARLEGGSDGPHLLVSVLDTGIGIARERVPTIIPLPDSPPRDGGRSGLGLAISDRLAGMMGGRLLVMSRQGIGSCFTLRVPLATPRRSQGAPLPYANVPVLAGRRVLLVDDEPLAMEMLTAMLDGLGLEIGLAHSADDALQHVQQAAREGRAFDALVADLRLPGGDGTHLARQLRALGITADRLPIIALTASTDPADHAACRGAGMQAVLTKPTSALALVRELARFLSPQDDRETRLAASYCDRKAQLLATLGASLARDPARTDWDEVAGELHRMAGVAGHFGESELGEWSRQLEERLRDTAEPRACLAELRRAWPSLARAA